MPLPNEYRGLMRDAINEGSSSGENRPLKKRKRGRKTADEDSRITTDSGTPTPIPEIMNSPVQGNKEMRPGGIVFDIQQTPEPHVNVNLEIKEVDGGDTTSIYDNDDDEDDEDEDDIFEDVDLENFQQRASNQVADVVVAYEGNESRTKSKNKTNRNVIDKEEKQYRRQFHKSYLVCMMIHGLIRNKWCNSDVIHQRLRKLVTTQVYEMLHPPKSIKLPAHRTRRLLDGLRLLMGVWVKYYKVTSNKGLYKHDWYDWNDIKRTPTDFERFKKCLVKGRGSRDIAAQGFVCLLRSIDVPSRLCFSLQPPDFTNNKIIPKSNVESTKSSTGSVKDKLVSLRKGKVTQLSERPKQGEIEQKYPVWWVEVWDSSSKSWISIDPVMFQTIEVVKFKSKLEPPLTNKFNTLTYVIGYDRQSGVRDITKRYAEKYYSRTRKKRITKDGREKDWYDRVLASISQRQRNRIDDYEDEFFSKKQEMEGMPDSIQDFKNHPNYVIESHLRSNEILKPDQQPVGMIRIKGKNEALKVFKRSDVQILKTSRGWFQQGRTLKAGQRALRTKQKTANQLMWRMDEDEETEERLYAEYQTELYVPPPVTEDGLITKNAYGNLDVYVASMVPKGAVHIKSEFAEAAAKKLGIDYAKAVVGFKFERRKATPKIDGIIVAEDLADAVEVIDKELDIENREKQKMLFEIRALKGWELMMTKLRIRQRLDKSHGKVEGDEDEMENDYDNDDSEAELKQLENEYEEYLNNGDDESDLEQGDDFELGNGGFVVDHSAGGFVPEPEQFSTEPLPDDEFGDGGAGFIVEDSSNNKGYNGNIEEEVDTGAGFIVDDNDQTSDTNQEHTRDAETEDESDGLDEFDAFMDQLDDVSVDEDNEENEKSEIEECEECEVEEVEEVEVVEEVEEAKPSNESIKSIEEQQNPQVEEKNEQFQREHDFNNFGSDSATGDASPEVIEISSSEDSESINVRLDTENENSLQRMHKEPPFDQEMDEQFQKQLEEETQKNRDIDDEENDDNDFEFDYDSE